MKFRLVHNEVEQELIVLTENGGIALLRSAPAHSDDEVRVSTTDFYHARVTDFPNATKDNIFDLLAEKEMSYEDYETDTYSSLTCIKDALHWLCPKETSWEISEDLFTDLFPFELNKEAA